MSKRPFLGVCKFVSASVLVILPGALPAADSGLFSTERTETARQSATNAAGQEAKRSIWDGVYTLEQTQRGQTVYKRVCGYCHRDDLSGGGSEDGAPPLIGPPFYYKWRDLTVAEMLVTIAETMPRNAPASLSRQAYIDIISFLLKANEMPAGDAELLPEIETLDQILFTENPAIR